MTKSAVAITDIKSSTEAGQHLGRQINEKLDQQAPDVIILFASSDYDYNQLLTAIKNTCSTEILVGSSSAGEFTTDQLKTNSACAIGIRSTEIKFAAGIAEGISKDRQHVAEALFSNLAKDDDYDYMYHSAMVFADALSGFTDELIDNLTELTVGKYQFFGGGAGDDAKFQNTHVFFGEQCFADAAVILEILSNKPVGVGVSHGWKPLSKKMRVTAAKGRELISLNARPAIDVYKEYAEENGGGLDLNQPIPYFLNNILGIESAGEYKLRAPIGLGENGSIIMASDVPVGSNVYVMGSGKEEAKKAAVDATENALAQLGDNKPNVALFFDCVATRLRLGHEFDFELDKIKEKLNGIDYAGCNTYGQVARVNGQFSGFQNCSAVVCILPE